jgi:hypothetical protein
MSRRNNESRKWVAHVWVEGGECKEVTVTAADRWDASAIVRARLGLKDANDPVIRRFVMEEVIDPPKPPDPAASGTSVVSLRPMKNWYRYRVRLYAGPNSGTPISRYITTTSAQDALWDVMKLYALATEKQLGPYCVQEETRGGLITRLIKDGHTFPDAGPLDKGPPAKIENRHPVDDHFAMEEPALKHELELENGDSDSIWSNYERAQERARENEWTNGWNNHIRRPTEAVVLKRIEDIFKGEATVPHQKRKVVKA